MDMFLASFGIIGWGVAISVSLWFNSETRRLAAELRSAARRIDTLAADNNRLHAMANKVMSTGDKVQPGAALRRQLRSGYVPQQPLVFPTTLTTSGGRATAPAAAPQQDNLLPGMIIGMALGSATSKGDDTPAQDPAPCPPSPSYDSGSSCDSGSGSASYDSGSSGGGID